MNYDLIVIGGGPAGMMAAGRAAANGARVLILEKNDRLGLKLLITGKGRCNLTTAELEQRKIINKYGPTGKFLFSALSRFGPAEVMDFFGQRGVRTKVESRERVFSSGDAGDVLQALLNYLKQNKVEIRTNAMVKSIVSVDKKITKVILWDGQEVSGKNYAVCTGGKSYPLTGSSGEGYNWLQKLGHTIIPPRPALAPVIVFESWVRELEGLSLKDADISLYQNNKKMDSRFGEAVFTGEGMSGPIILDLSKTIGQLLPSGPVELAVDFQPELDSVELNKKLQAEFVRFGGKTLKNSLAPLLPRTLIPVIIRLVGLDPDKRVSSIVKDERQALVGMLKNFRLKVKRVDGFNNAIVTTGGVETKEVDPKTMKSKIITNLYLAGEVLDLDGPTGGYNLQICWSTGFAVGEGLL